jgi:hypothetical protein
MRRIVLKIGILNVLSVPAYARAMYARGDLKVDTLWPHQHGGIHVGINLFDIQLIQFSSFLPMHHMVQWPQPDQSSKIHTVYRISLTYVIYYVIVLLTILALKIQSSWRLNYGAFLGNICLQKWTLFPSHVRYCCAVFSLQILIHRARH